MDLWTAPWEQKHDSRKTARPQVPALFKRIEWRPLSVNADIGGGPFYFGTRYLAAEHQVLNVIYDPFNRDDAHNAWATELLRGGKASTATVANTLNVIAEPENRMRVIRLAADALAPDGTAYFSAYEGGRGGKGEARQTSCGWQEGRPLKSYIPEIAKVFGEVEMRGGIIVARRPRKLAAAPRQESVERVVLREWREFERRAA